MSDEFSTHGSSLGRADGGECVPSSKQRGQPSLLQSLSDNGEPGTKTLTARDGLHVERSAVPSRLVRRPSLVVDLLPST
jgi:hypothetical protein